MASASLANADYALPISVKNLTIGSCISMVFLLTACGFAELSVKHHNFNKSKAKSNQLATINLHFDNDELTEPYEMELVRVRGRDKGYALRAPLYQEEEGAIHFTVAKQKEMKWFFGIRGRWEF